VKIEHFVKLAEKKQRQKDCRAVESRSLR